jgi:DNA-binding GntR family transcriptional regulator
MASNGNARVQGKGGRVYQHVQRDVGRDSVVAVIEAALASGRLRPGDRVIETDIARQTGISRGPVREALQQLVAEEVLVNYPYRGTFVTKWSARDVAEVYGLRAVLEGYAAHRALEHMDEDSFAELERIVNNMCELARQGDGEGVSELDICFHTRLYEFSGHRLLCNSLASLRRRIRMLVTIDRELTQDLVQLAENHRMLLDALRSGDPAHAEDVFRQHIIEVGDGLVARMRAMGECEEDEEGWEDTIG